jgi:DNA-directed RNA polymerase specialized sigma24 family protein
MYDAIAAPSAPKGAPRPVIDRDRLSRLVTLHNDRLVRRLRARLGTRWHLAEDLAQNTWLLAAMALGRCPNRDERVWPWLVDLSDRAMVAHFRQARAAVKEVPADGAAGRRMPVEPSAEDVAISQIITLMLTADAPALLEVAA